MATTKETVERFWQAFSTGDAAGMTAVLHPDVTWTVVGRHAPVAREYVGRDAFFGELLAGLAQAFDMSTLRMERIGLYADEDEGTGVLHLRETATSVTGNAFDNEIIDVMTVRDGRIVAVREVMDLAEVNQAFASEGVTA